MISVDLFTRKASLSRKWLVCSLALAICGGLLTGSAMAQEVDAAEVAPPLAPNSENKPFAVNAESAPLPVSQRGNAESSDDLSGATGSHREISAVPKRFQYAVRLNLRSVYDDNIFLQPIARTADTYFAIEGGITLGFGDIVGKDANYVRIDYAPSFYLFLNHSEADATQHIFRLDARYRFGRLTLNLAQDIQFLQGPNYGATATSTTNPGPTFNLDTRGATDVNTYNTHADLTYDLTGKTFLSGGLLFTANEYKVLISSEQTSGNLFINYTYSPKLTVGLGGTAGYTAVESPNPSQTFQQANIRFTYEPSGKLSLNATGGYEFRQYEDSGLGGGNVTTPVFELGAAYQPFDGTSINLRGSRRSLNSAVLQAQNYDSTTFDVTVRQRFLRRIYFGVNAGFESSSYHSTVTTLQSDRSDNYFFVQPSIDVTLTAFWTAGVYYLYRNNDSSSPFYSFYDNQFGLRTSVFF